ncbi:hypothetical protein IW261DRAFT_1422365 [Armillaria novae-zelandiae]|uniref:Uncharacterized protein n=1 Tax=Armillaria novae-zelandiae TaxID=153914 RepID=A0AA39P101_9AGAR|nr:hypothetical protein IW261DRAFT_1422365 [Armillaria novae-zelandiae]
MSRNRNLEVGIDPHVIGLSSFIVSAKDDHYATLNNKQGQTPCELVEEMEWCSQARAVRQDTAFGEQEVSRPQHLKNGEPSANWYSTNVFFNIWSVCLRSQGNYSLTPDQWQNQCEQQKLHISTFKRSVEDHDRVPMWAYAEMPVNQTFNIRQATDSDNSEDQSGSWSRYQIITIVAISCSVIGVATILLFLYRWRSLWARHHVRSDSRDNDWAIDDEVEALEDYHYVGTPSTSRHGHVRLASTPTPYDAPPQRTWYIRSQDFFRKTKNKFLDISEFIPRPWRTKPVHVKAFSRDMLFDIDGSSKTDSTLENYRTGGNKQMYAPQAEPGPRRFSRYSTMDNESYMSNNGEDQPGFEADSEQERLITPSEEFPEPPPSVLLISQGGRDFTLESGESRSQQHHAVSQEREAPVASSSRPPEPGPGVKVQHRRGTVQRIPHPWLLPVISPFAHLPLSSSIAPLSKPSKTHPRPISGFRLTLQHTLLSLPLSTCPTPTMISPSSPLHHTTLLPLQDERILTPPSLRTPPPPLTPPHPMATPYVDSPAPAAGFFPGPIGYGHIRGTYQARASFPLERTLIYMDKYLFLILIYAKLSNMYGFILTIDLSRVEVNDWRFSCESTPSFACREAFGIHVDSRLGKAASIGVTKNQKTM